MKRVTYPLVLAFALYIGPAAYADVLGHVVGVIDGDTLDVLTPSKELVRVRLAGIDAPEKRQPFGAVAKRRLSDLSFDKAVLIEGAKRDRYGRLIAKVMVGGRDANLQMVQAGLAWHYKKYEREQLLADRSLYAAAQNTAQAKKVGLWSEPSPTAPWDFRSRKRKTH